MNGTAFGWGFAVAVAVAWFGLASPAAAETCATDRDCIDAGAACGTEVCSHPAGNQTSGECTAPVGGFASYCVADTDCKCHSLGAACVPAVDMDIVYPPYCSFTTPDGAAPVALPDRKPDAGAPPIDGSASAEEAGRIDPSAGDAASGELPLDASDETSTVMPDASTSVAGSPSSTGCGCVMGPATPVSWGVPAGLLGIALALGRRRRPG